MAALAILAAGSALAAALGASGELGLRTEARARPPLASGPAVATDLELSPRGALQLGERAVSLTLALEPRLLLSSEASMSAMAGGQLRVDWRPLPGLSFSAQEQASYGTTNFSSLSAPAPSAAGPEPTTAASQPIVGSLKTVSSYSAASFDWQLSIRWRAAASLGYQISGGSDPLSRQTLPLQRGPRATSSLSLALSPHDTLITQFTIAQARFSPSSLSPFGSRGLEASLSEGIRSALSPATTVGLVLGASLVRNEDPPLAPVRQILPLGEVTVSLLPAARLQTSFSVRAAPLFDRITGAAYQRADVGARLAWTATEQLAFSASTSAGVVMFNKDQNGDFLGTLDIAASRALSRQWSLAMGLRGAWQRQRQASGSQDGFFQWTAFLGAQFAMKEPL